MIELTDPDRAFALGHVPKGQRAAVAALWALDEQLGQIVASTTQPMVGQMRLLWWREALNSGVSGHPLLEELTSVRACGVDADALGKVIDGWEELLEPLPLSEAQLTAFAAQRGWLIALCRVDADNLYILTKCRWCLVTTCRKPARKLNSASPPPAMETVMVRI